MKRKCVISQEETVFFFTTTTTTSTTTTTTHGLQQEIEMLLGLFSYVCLLHLLDSQGAIEPIVVMIVLMLET